MVAGHSLGGGLAQIVGAKIGQPAVSFSGPGVLDTRHKFGLSRQLLINSVVNVIPSHDVVPLAGMLGGTVVTWDCHNDPFVCHMPMLAPCGMHALCPRNDKHSMKCATATGSSTMLQRIRAMV